MTVQILIPWRGGDRHRERALGWVTERLEWPVTVCEPPAGPWCKAAAINPVALSCDADIVVVHDADVYCEGLGEAIEAVEQGEPWAMPHEYVRRLTLQATDSLIDGPNISNELEEPAYKGVWGGGIVVAPKATLVDVPLDLRFVGWGGEDVSWAVALWFLAGPAWRGQHDLLHLWHPPQERLTRVRGSVQNWALLKRYRQARFNVEQMRALVDEIGGLDAGNAPEHPLHAGSPV